MTDPLAAFRRKPVGPAQPPTSQKSKDEYLAFDAKDKVSRLKIWRAKYPGRSPHYSLLIDMVYSGEGITQVVLVFTYMMVYLKGQNLSLLLTALELQTADYIQEYDPAKWLKPADTKAPFIESIEVKLKEAGPGLAEPEKWCKVEPGQSIH